MKISLLIFALVALNHSELLNEWKTLESTEYSIIYPDDWSLDESGMSGTKLILFCPVIQGQAFRNNVNLIVQDLSGMGINLDKYIEISVGQIKQYITAAEIHYSQTKNSRHEIIYSGKNGELSLKWRQYYWVKDEKAYVLTFTADANSYEGQMKLVNKMMDSFTIKGK
jgi:hypothetical protein